MSVKDLVVFKPVSDLITTAGTFVLQVTRFSWINSHTQNFDGAIKEGVYDAIASGDLWETPGEELAVTLGGLHGEGVITVRHHFEGYLKTTDEGFDESILDEEGIKVISWKGTEYVCRENKSGTFDRIPVKEKTEKAINKTMQFFSALGVKPGQTLDASITSAMENNYAIKAVVEIDKYQGKEIPKVTKWLKVTDADLETEEQQAPAMSEDDLKM